MKKIKILSLIMAIVMIVGLFAGCGEKPAETTTEAKTTEAPTTAAPVADDKTYNYGTVHGITWQNGGTADKADATAVMREEERNAMYLVDTGNTRECVAFSYDYQTVAAMFEGGQLPTTFSVAATEPVKLIRNGWGRDITAQVEQVGIKLENFNQAILETYKDADGKLYGLPYTAYALCILCNGKVFIDAGLVNADGTPDLPETWEEVKEAALKIKEKTGKGGFALTACDNQGGWNFTNVAWNFGADLVVMNDDGSYTAQVNAPEAVAAMTWYKDMAVAGGFGNDPTVDTRPNCMTLLAAGEVGMCFGASDNPNQLCDKTSFNMNPADVYAVSIPAGPDGTKKNLTGGAGYWFSPDATDEQVIAVLEYYIHYGTWADEYTETAKASYAKTMADALAKNKPTLPDFPVYNSAVYTAKWDEAMENNKQLEGWDFSHIAKFYDDVQQAGALQTEEEGDTQNLYREMTAVIQQIVTDPAKADVQKLMDTAQDAVAQLLADF